MPVETAADRAAFVNADEFGVAVAWDRAGTVSTFDAIFDADYQLLATAFDEGGQEGAAPQIVCPSSSLPFGAAHKDTLTVTNPETLALIGTYRVVEIKPDGTGMTTVRLQES